MSIYPNRARWHHDQAALLLSQGNNDKAQVHALLALYWQNEPKDRGIAIGAGQVFGATDPEE